MIGGFIVLSLGAALTSAISLSRLQRQFGRLQRLGAYTLERQISEGGMATIYLARHALLKRPTAIKILKKHVATDEFVHRFEREVQIASQLLHPNTVRIYDFGRTREGQPYYVMEYLDGVTLAELVAHSGPVPPGRVIHILRQVGAALREAHEHGMIHRDVKPENVMLCRRGEDDVVKLLDFGLVKNLERAHTRDITKQIKILGTPRYMAPERILNPSDVDARSDIYALGAVGYFLLTGKPIFDGDDNLEITNQVLHAPAPRASASADITVPEGLDLLIAACLEKDRARRPQSVEAVIEALDRLSSRLAWTQVDAEAWWAALSREQEVRRVRERGGRIGRPMTGRIAPVSVGAPSIARPTPTSHLARLRRLEQRDHLAISARLRQRERRRTAAVRKIDIRAGVHQGLERRRVSGPAIAQHDRFDQRRPAEVVDVIERRAATDQNAHDLDMAQMRRGDQRGSVVTAGDVRGTAAQREGDVERRQVVRDRRDGDDVVAVTLQRVRIGACLHQRPHCVVLAGEGGNVQRGAAVPVTCVDTGAGSDEPGDLARVAAGCGGKKSRIPRALVRGGRQLAESARPEREAEGDDDAAQEGEKHGSAGRVGPTGDCAELYAWAHGRCITSGQRVVGRHLHCLVPRAIVFRCAVAVQRA